jgi:hypothetical protein
MNIPRARMDAMTPREHFDEPNTSGTTRHPRNMSNRRTARVTGSGEAVSRVEVFAATRFV